MNKISVLTRRGMQKLFISLPYEDTERKQLSVNKRERALAKNPIPPAL